MQARTDSLHPISPMDLIEIRNGSRPSFGALMRDWGPYVLTALVVPGGIVIALLLLWTRWNQRRQAAV
jgi:hypothetical protein